MNDEKLSKISACLNGEDQLDAWVIEGRRVIPLLKRMAPKTAVSAVADKVARYQVKQNELEALNQANNCHSEQSSFELDEQLSGRANHPTNAVTRKRVNSCESTSAKRKYQVSSKSKDSIASKQHSDRLANSSTPTSTGQLPTTSLPISGSSPSSGCSNSAPATADKQGQPKLLIMSTGSMLNKPTIVNSSPTDQHQLNVGLDASKHQIHQIQSVPQQITLTSSSTSAHKSSLTEVPVSSSLAHQLIATSQSAKVYNPKVQSSTSPKLMILPNSSQTKTLTIPISHKTLQLPAQNLQNSTILYSQQPIVTGTAGSLVNCSTSGTLKSMPGITIQTIKSSQGSSKPNHSNFIIMPNKAATGAQQISQQTAVSGAKGLLRQMNAKEFPVKFIAPDGLLKKESSDRTAVDPNVQQQQQPTIILTNVSKETANSLTGSPIRNLVHPNIIKVVPKPASNSLQAGKANRQTSPNQKAFHPITIPAGNATTFMEILKNIPINRISPQNPNSSGGSTFKTIKIPANSTTESISKLIFNNVNNVMTSHSLTGGSSADVARRAPKGAGSTEVKVGLDNSETAKKETNEVRTDEANKSGQSESTKNLATTGGEESNCDLVEKPVVKGASVCDDTASKEPASVNDDLGEKRPTEEGPPIEVSNTMKE